MGMTLNEAVTHLDDILKPGKEWGCEECKNEHIALREWLIELMEYRKMNEQGLLLRLPCKIGDPVYAIEVDGEHFEAFRCPLKIGKYEFSLEMLEMIGKCVFLTREEAEEELKRKEAAGGE